MAENTPEGAPNFIELAGDITIAWLQNPNVNPGAEDVPAFLQKMHAAIAGLGGDIAPEPEAVTHHPAVSVRSSVKPDHLVSLIDGKKYKTLKRHLATNGLTPDEYRARYGLKSDYPMVAESYTAQRREIANQLGLGRKRSAPVEALSASVEAAVETPVTAPAKPKRAAGTKAATPKASKAKAAKPEAKTAPEAVTAPVAEAELAPKPALAKAKRAASATTKAAVKDIASDVTAPAKKPVAKPKKMARPSAAAASEPSEAVTTTRAPAKTQPQPSKTKPGKTKPGKPKTVRKTSAKSVKAEPAVVPADVAETATGEA